MQIRVGQYHMSAEAGDRYCSSQRYCTASARPGVGTAPGTRSNHRLSKSQSPFREAFGYLKRVIVTPAVYPRLVESLHFDIQSTGQKSHCVNITL